MNAKGLKLLLLIGVYFVYLVIGAGIFYAIEGPAEKKRCDEAKAYIANFANLSNFSALTAGGNLSKEFVQHIINVR